MDSVKFNHTTLFQVSKNINCYTFEPLLFCEFTEKTLLPVPMKTDRHLVLQMIDLPQ